MQHVLNRVLSKLRGLPVVTVALCAAMALGFAAVHLIAFWHPGTVGPAADAFVEYLNRHPGATRDRHLVRLAIRASEVAKDPEVSRRLLSEVEGHGAAPAAEPECERLRAALLEAWRASPAVVLGLDPSRPWPWSFATHLFVHIDLLHLLPNLLLLAVAAAMTERWFGVKKLLVVFLGSGAIAGGFYVVENAFRVGALVGASGAASGLLGAFLVAEHQKARRSERTPSLLMATIPPSWVALGVWVAYQLVSSRLLADSDPTAYSVHVVGLVAGVVLALWNKGAPAPIPNAHGETARKGGRGGSPRGATAQDLTTETGYADAFTDVAVEDRPAEINAALARLDMQRALGIWRAMLASGDDPGPPQMRWRMARALAATRPDLSKAILADLADDPLAGELSSQARARLANPVPAPATADASSTRNELRSLLGVAPPKSEMALGAPPGLDGPTAAEHPPEDTQVAVSVAWSAPPGMPVPSTPKAEAAVKQQPRSAFLAAESGARAPAPKVLGTDLPSSKLGRLAFWSLLATIGLAGLVAASRFEGAPVLFGRMARQEIPVLQAAAALLAAVFVLLWRIDAPPSVVWGSDSEGHAGLAFLRRVIVVLAAWYGCVAAAFLVVFRGSELHWYVGYLYSVAKPPTRLAAAAVLGGVVVAARVAAAVRRLAPGSGGRVDAPARILEQGCVRLRPIVAWTIGAALGSWLLVSAPGAFWGGRWSPAQSAAVLFGRLHSGWVTSGVLGWVVLVLAVLFLTAAAVGLSFVPLTRPATGGRVSTHGEWPAARRLGADSALPMASVSPLLVTWIVAAVAPFIEFSRRRLAGVVLNAAQNVRIGVVVLVATLLILVLRRVEVGRACSRLSPVPQGDGITAAEVRSRKVARTRCPTRGMGTVEWLLVVFLVICGVFSATNLEAALAIFKHSVIRSDPPGTAELVQQASWELLAVALFLIWVYQAAKRAQCLRGGVLAFSPAAAVGWFFVPVMNLWKPYEVVREIGAVTLERQGVGRRIRILSVWWALAATLSLASTLVLHLTLFARSPLRGSCGERIRPDIWAERMGRVEGHSVGSAFEVQI